MKGHIKIKCWKKDPLQTPEKYKGKKTEKAGAAIEEEHLLLFVDMCDYVCMQVDIEEAYILAPLVSIDYGFRKCN
jgi:hypothetical protein